MKDKEAKELCIKLMKADSEDEVISILDNANYWSDHGAWRYYGDRENNFSTIGNQQSRPDAALVEKLVNSIDARLLNECLLRGVDPESTKAPKSIREAVAIYFEGVKKHGNDYVGRISGWGDSKRTDVARNITLAATGFMPSSGKPSFAIADNGEGQTPDKMPTTFLSLDKSNKLRIPFVQGKFNMGGTGVLGFCSRHNLQMILSRRNPALINKTNNNSSDQKWGFTIIRRNDPEEGRRNSVYNYLAPLFAKARPGQGDVLRFYSEEIPIFPEGRNPYERLSKWGSFIKLYEYDITGYKSHILRKDGILGRLELLMPEAALPIRLFECRSGYRGHPGSFETTLTGLGIRLEDGKAENIEQGFPVSCPLAVRGEQITAKIFVFKKGRAETYRKSEGIIFILNGQTHAHLTTDFFRRKNVALSYLADSLLVLLDCSSFGGRAIEDLFINSRDRLRKGELHDSIIDSLEKLLKENEGLRRLKEERRREEIESRLEDSKPLEEVLEALLKNSPVLSELFLLGKRITSPFKTADVQNADGPFEGKKFPSYFRFKGKEYGHILKRQSPINRNCRIAFETDAENDYFGRSVDKGSFSLFLLSNEGQQAVQGYFLNLQNGIATLNIELPLNCHIGDNFVFNALISDINRLEPFINHFEITVLPEATTGGGKSSPGKPPSDKKGDDRKSPSGIQLPRITEVYEHSDNGKKTWADLEPHFDKYSALRIRYVGGSDDPNDGDKANGPEIYDFFINVDNAYARMELKSGKIEPEVARARFVYGMVLIGLGLLQQQAQDRKRSNQFAGRDKQSDEDINDNIENKVEEFSRAIAPILLPMIDGLGALDIEATEKLSASGETD
jgi:hypothetical protein